MKLDVDELPNWTFVLDEVSAGIYRVQAEHPSGPRVDLTGTDPQQIIEAAKASASSIAQQLDALRRVSCRDDQQHEQ
jgi:hypothetical protein